MEPNNIFPIEIWWQIFSFLSIADLCNVTVLSKYFRDISQEPKLWKKGKIRREKLESEGVEVFLRVFRFHQVEELDLSYMDLTNLRIPVLVAVCRQFRKLRFKYAILTNVQKEVILAKTQQSTPLKKLDLDSVSLKDVKVGSVSKVATGKDCLSLKNTGLQEEHINSLLVNIRFSFLTNLNLSCLNLSHISSHLFIPAVSSLKTLQLGNTDLTTIQISFILSECIWSTSMETLNLSSLDLTEVECQLLMDSFCCLSCVKLSSCRFSRKQLTTILDSITLDHSTLEHIDLSTVDISQIPSNLLAKSLPKLTKVNLNYTKGSTEQLTALLRSALKSESLQELEMGNLNLSQVPVNLMAKVCHSLKYLNLNYTKMTREQTMAVVGAASTSSTLKHLTLVRSNLICVPLAVFRLAASHLEIFNTNFATKTKQQQQYKT